MQLKIAELGDPVLRVKASEVSPDEIKTDAFQQFVGDLVETMRAAQGAGLAAPQVSRSIQVFAACVQNNQRYPYKPEFPLTIAINPKITMLSEDTYLSNEGCLSIPNLRCQVKRCPLILLEAFGLDGKPYRIRIGGVTAGTFQHEYDHLMGTLIVDRAEETSTFSTWENFKVYYEEQFTRTVRQVEQTYSTWEELD